MSKAISKSVLKNGVRIVTRKIAHVRSVSMGVWVDVGARDETEAESGLSHFIEHMIFKGTSTRSAYQIAKQFDAIGGHTNAFTSMENTCYHAKVMDTHLETMVDILLDIFLGSVFDPDEIERERPVIVQEIGMIEDSPEEFIHVLASRSFWGEHALGRSIIGTRDNIIGFTRKAIVSYFRRLYQPERVIVCAAGNVDHDHFVDLVGATLETLTASNHFLKRETPVGCAGISSHQRDLEQAHLCLGTKGLAIVDERRYAFSLMNTLLGGNMSSRLFQKIREQRGLAYSVYSFMASHADSGMFGAYAGVDPKNANETIGLILEEMRTLKEVSVSADELRDAKEFTKGSLLLSSESVDNQMVRLAQNEIHFQKFIPVEDVVARIEAVKAEDVQSLAKALFQPDFFTLNSLGSMTAPVIDQNQLADLLN
jgi:predicted Zn-dependent peptidase